MCDACVVSRSVEFNRRGLKSTKAPSARLDEMFDCSRGTLASPLALVTNTVSSATRPSVSFRERTI